MLSVIPLIKHSEISLKCFNLLSAWLSYFIFSLLARNVGLNTIVAQPAFFIRSPLLMYQEKCVLKFKPDSVLVNGCLI